MSHLEEIGPDRPSVRFFCFYRNSHTMPSDSICRYWELLLSLLIPL